MISLFRSACGLADDLGGQHTIRVFNILLGEGKKMDFKNASKNALIAGGLFALMALNMLFGMFDYFNFWNLLWMASYAAIAAMLFMGKRDIFAVGSFGAMAVVSLLSVLRYFNLFGIIGFLPNLAILFVVGVTLTDYLPQYKATAAKFWFLPAVLAVVSMVFSLLISIFGGYFPLTIWTLIRIAALLFAGLWAVCPYGSFQDAMSLISLPSGNHTASSGYTAPASGHHAAPVSQDYGDGYCGLVKHILLLLFTFGIWLYIWIYRTTRYLNCVEDEEQRNPTNQLLLCLFVPFYYIYWMYKSAQRIDKISAARGKSDDMAMLCLILSLFVAIIPPILMQDKINGFATAGAAKAAYQAPQYQAPQQSYQAPQYQVPQQTYQAPQYQEPQAYQTAQTPSYAKPAAQAPKTNATDIAAELKVYKDLLDMGIITPEEFEAKKKQLLNL